VPAAVSVSAGLGHTCAVTAAGAGWCWGANSSGQLGNGTTSTTATGPTMVQAFPSGLASISAGGVHTCAVTTAGAAKCWGLNNVGQLGNGTSGTTAVTAPVSVSGLSSGVSSISAGYAHTCAVSTAGAALCWGYNAAGQVGTAAPAPTSPVAVSGLSTVPIATISAGYLHTCAVSQAGAAVCWGWSNKGQLGNGSTTFSVTPVVPTGLAGGVLAISAGDAGLDAANPATAVDGMHTCAITAAGGPECWGNNADGELGDGGTAQQTKPVMVQNYQR
jgi:alpha-tubulin suppressor-like RCC1 family protein